MVEPLTLQEQMKETYFVPDYRLVVYCAASHYDAVWKRDRHSNVAQALPDLPLSEHNCTTLRAALEKYDFVDTGPGGVYNLDDDPTKADADEVVFSIRKRLTDNPQKNFIIVYILSGHGIQDSQRKQALVLNEFHDKTRYYKLWPLENNIRPLAEDFSNSYHIVFCVCSRAILDHGVHSGGFPTK